MVTKSKVVAFIPARRDSERLPKKNKKLFCGKPLILWTFDLAILCDFIDDIIISTNDDDIIEICSPYVSPFSIIYKQKPNIIIKKRPEKLAQAETPLMDVLKYELQDYEDDANIILLQPTSPLRDFSDIFHAYDTFFMGVCKEITPVIGAYFDEKNKCFQLNGIIFIGKKKYIFNDAKGFFKDPHIICIPEERSIDIDTLEDFEKAEHYMKQQLEVEKRAQEYRGKIEKETKKMRDKLRHVP